MDNAPLASSNISQEATKKGPGKKIIIIIAGIILFFSFLGVYLYLQQRQKKISTAVVSCNFSNCPSGCCDGNKCQAKNTLIDGYTCRGANKWQASDGKIVLTLPDKGERIIVTPKVSTDDEVFLKVGEETIFKKDYEKELEAVSPIVSGTEEAVKKYLTEKMVEDSIILQENKSKIGSIASEIYNSLQKNYEKRVNTAFDLKSQKIKELVGDVNSKEGYLIKVWNLNMKESVLGYEKSKEIAYKKITDLYTLVKNKTITIEEAGERIKNDAELEKIDFYYKNNAIYPFKITSERDICEGCLAMPLPELWRLDLYGLSQIYFIKLSDKEELYAFGQVTKINNGPDAQTYEEWYKRIKSSYNIEIK